LNRDKSFQLYGKNGGHLREVFIPGNPCGMIERVLPMGIGEGRAATAGPTTAGGPPGTGPVFAGK
jgi:hypothetical protein